MGTNAVVARNRFYYRCAGRYNGGLAACSASRYIQAEKAEAEVWGFVRDILTDPSRLTVGLEKMQENEASSASAEDEEASWLKRISKLERKEERLLELRLEGDISTEQFRVKSAALQEAKEAAATNLTAARSRRSRRKDFERDKEALLEYHARLVPEDLEHLTSEQRRTLYRMMRLTVLATPDGELIAEWGCNESTTPPGSFRTRGR
ncbi:MAG TPA: zinc ribbon domain-containing protein [Rubrobacteraceae bacterium]|nr:zinc ribbon domain-containing protein [Rubrobacteraceae bacterium]